MDVQVTCLVSMRKGNVRKLADECGLVGECAPVRFKRNGWAMPVTVGMLADVSAAHLEVHHVRVVTHTAGEWCEAQTRKSEWELARAGFPALDE